MNANVSKTNTGKLLAAIMIMAVLIAGVAMVFSGDSVKAAPVEDVTDITSIVEDSTAEVDASTAAVSYYVPSNVTINVTDNTNAVTLYLKAGVTVTLKGTTSNVTMYVSSDYTGTTVTPVDALSVKAGPNAVDKTYTAGTNSITTTDDAVDASSVSGITFETANNTTYYAEGSTQTISISETDVDVVTITKGTATVNQGSNQVTISSTESVNATVTAGENYPALSNSDNKATVTINSGFFTGSDVTITNGVVLVANGTTYYASQIYNKVGTDAVATADVKGEVAQKNSVGDAKVVQESEPAAGIALTITGTLIINNNVNVYVTNITGSGNVTLFGALYSQTEATIAAGKIGPNGYFSNVTITDASNTNVTEGKESYVSGDFYGTLSQDSVIGSETAEDDETIGLTVPEGQTLTISGNLGLNGQTLYVNGTLVIENKGSIFGTGDVETEGIVLGAKGVIQNNGTIGKMLPVKISYVYSEEVTQSISIQGVSGVDFTIDKNNGMTVTGNVTATSGAKANTLTIDGAVITGDFTTAKKVALELTNNAIIAKNAAVVLNGDVTGTTKTIALSEGSSISINGEVTGVSITAAVGLLEDSSTLDSDNDGTVTISSITNVAGFTMYVKKVAVANESDNSTDYYLRAYVNGSLAKVDKSTGADDPAITINGENGYNVYVAAEETLTAGEGVTLNMDYVYIEGTIVIASNAGEDNIENYTGAMYNIETTGENNQPVITTYYTTLAAAMDKIADANDDGVTANVKDLDINVTVAEGQTLTLNVTGTISQDAVLTVQNGGTLYGNITDVDGKMVVQAEADAVTPGNYDVMSTSEDGTVTYAGIAVAIAEAQPGDKITVGTADIGSADSAKQSLTIPQGVEVTVTDRLTIHGDLTVAAEATLIGGAINMAYDGAKVTVNGTLDVSDNGSLTGDNFTVTSTGSAIFAVTGMPANYNGAVYDNDDGNKVITTVANAVKYVAENDITAPVAIHGKVTETADLVLDGVDVKLDPSAEVVLGNVTLTDATITSTGAKLTAVVTGMNGEGDAAVNGTVSVNKSAVVIDAAQVVNAAGTTVYTYTISAIDGTMTVQSGTVVLKGENVTTAAGSKFTVASGATLLVGKGAGLTVSGDKNADVAATEFTVEGTLEVDEGQVTFASGKSVINGTVNISGNGIVNAAALVINGTVNVSAVENDEGTFTVTNNGVTVGDAKEALGSTGSIVGIIGFDDDGKYIIAYAGTDMSGAKLANDAEFETTAYYVNDALYATAYAEAAGVETPIDSAVVSQLPGIDKDQDEKITWATADGTDITTNFDDVTIGQYDAVYAKAPLDQIKIKISVGTGISLYVDNVKIVSETYELTIGTHTVSATVNPGYAGEVTISFNGQTVTGGSIEITVDSEGVVLSALGDISVDTGSTSGGDSGMGLTEILLIILVVLIVVMAIMVALRLMRS